MNAYLSAKGPVITLYSNDTVHVYKLPNISGCHYEVSRSTFDAYDSVYGDLTDHVVLTSNVDCAVAGWYTIDFRVGNPNGDSAFRRRTVHVITPVDPPDVSFSISGSQIEIYSNLRAFGSANYGAYQFEWTLASPSGIVATGNQQNPVFTIDEIGQHTLCFRAKNLVGWSDWYCGNIDGIPPLTYYMGPQHFANWDSGFLYSHNGPSLLYDNNRKVTTDYFTIRTGAPEAVLAIQKFKVADTGDILKVYQGEGDTGKALHPSGGFTLGNTGTLPVRVYSKTGSFFVTFQSNGSGRDSGFMLQWKPAGDFRVKGLVYFDRDSNCIYDPKKDAAVPFYNLNFGNTRFAVTSVSGKFSIAADSAVKTIFPEVSKNWAVRCPVSGKDTWNFAAPKFFEFAMKPAAGSIMDLAAGITHFTGFTVKRGLAASLNVKVTNIGNLQADSFRCRLKTSRKVQNFKRAQGTYKSSDTTLEYVKYNLSVFGTTSDEILYTVPSTDTGTVSIYCNCFPAGTIPDSDSTGNTDSLKLRIVNAHDPNDKQVDVSSIFDRKNQVLRYFVRFQNTGTAAATDVVVRDTLSPWLDTASVEFLTASHSGYMERHGRALAFKFLGINLPDSNSNEPLSHGYFYYEVKTDAGIRQNMPIRNTAYIYFDAEKPVVTNTTENIWATYPRIRLNTPDTICHQINTPYTSTNVTVTDSYWPADKIAVSRAGTVNSNVKGLYAETYTATNESGNKSVRVRYIQVAQCLPLRLSKQNPDHLFRISPNPASDILYLKSDQPIPGSAELTITSVTGTTVRRCILPSLDVPADIADIPCGTYVLTITGNGRVEHHRLMIVKP